MFEKLKFYLHNNVGISTEYGNIKNKRELLNKKNNDYEDIIKKIKNVKLILDEIVDNISSKIKSRELSPDSDVVFSKGFEIERLENLIKNDLDDNQYIIVSQKLNELQREYKLLFNTVVINIFNKIKNGNLKDIDLLSKYKSFINSLGLLVQDERFSGMLDRQVMSIINKLLVEDINISYEELECLINFIECSLSRSSIILDDNKNNIYSFENSKKVILYNELENEQRKKGV